MHARPEGSKISRYDTAIQVEKTLGRPPIELQAMPDMPNECAPVWETFTRLSSCSYTEIKAYIDLTGDILQRWEIGAIIGLDNIRKNPPTRLPND